MNSTKRLICFMSIAPKPALFFRAMESIAGLFNTSGLAPRVFILIGCFIATLANAGVPYEAHPLYIESKKALQDNTPELAEKLTQQLANIPEYRARALRSLAIIEISRSNFAKALEYSNQSYYAGDKEAGPIYMGMLLEQNNIEEATKLWEPLFPQLYTDYQMVDNYFVLLQKTNTLDLKFDTCMNLVRRLPLETLRLSIQGIRFLIENQSKIKIEDKILLNFLITHTENSIRESILAENPGYTLKPPPQNPDVDTLALYTNYHNINILPIIKKQDWPLLYKEIEIILENSKYQLLGLDLLTDLAFYQGDFKRLEQLSELTLLCGQNGAVAPLFIALINNKKIKKGEKYLSYLVNASKQQSDRPAPAILIKYCFLTNNRQLFLDWARHYKWEDMLVCEGLRTMTIEGLQKWGESTDTLLLNYLNKTPAKSSEKYQW